MMVRETEPGAGAARHSERQDRMTGRSSVAYPEREGAPRS